MENITIPETKAGKAQLIRDNKKLLLKEIELLEEEEIIKAAKELANDMDALADDVEKEDTSADDAFRKLLLLRMDMAKEQLLKVVAKFEEK